MDGMGLIGQERLRQIIEEDYTAEHDREHLDGDLSAAAVCYAAPEPIFVKREDGRGIQFNDPWPWDISWDKRDKHDRVRRLVIAGALIAAEIDKIQEHKGAK